MKEETDKKRGKTVELDDKEIKELKILSAETGVPMKTLSKEAIGLLMKKYRKPTK